MFSKDKKTADSAFVQQHLANERTFLAWIRTGIAIVGLGFLAAGVVFRTAPYERLGHGIAALVGVGAVLLGGTVMALATREYFKKQTGINANTFRSPKWSVWITFASLGLINVFLLALVIVLLAY